MKATWLWAGLLVLSVATSAQQKIIDDPNAEIRQVGSFHAIEAHDGIDIYLTQGSQPAVAISASNREARSHVITRVENGVLKLYFDHGAWRMGWRNMRLRAYIAVTSLDGLQSGGGSDVIVQGALKVENLKMRFSGGSDFVGELSAGTLNIEQSGGSDVRIRGKAAKLELSASGGGNFIGYELLAGEASIRASGGSDVEVSVDKILYATASGGSDIRYKGHPDVRQSAASGGSSVSSRD